MGLALSTPDSPFCMHDSASKREPLVGTAPACVKTWILVEHTGVWSSKPLESPGLSKPVREKLKFWLKEIPASRVQLIRKNKHSNSKRTVQLKVVRVSQRKPFVISYALEKLTDLLEINLPSLIQKRMVEGVPGIPSEPLILVCTHGKRDRCCSKWGLPFYRQMEDLDAEHVWQTSHLGGHRFAATAVVFPQGYCYGRLLPQHARAFVQAVHKGEIFSLDHFRGYVGYSSPAQMAYVFLIQNVRDQSNLGFFLEKSVRKSDDEWEFYFKSCFQEKSFGIVSKREHSSRRILPNCFDEEKVVESWSSGWVVST